MATNDEDLEELVDCIDCGTTVAPQRDRAFSITDEMVLCYECSVRRGGVYDSDSDQWAIAPRLEEIPEEKRPQP